MRGWDWLLKTCKTWLMGSLPDLPQLANLPDDLNRLSLRTITDVSQLHEDPKIKLKVSFYS